MTDNSTRSRLTGWPDIAGREGLVRAAAGLFGKWGPDGRELFYRAGDDLISVQVRSTSPLVLGDRRKRLDVSALDSMYFHDFDVSPDGRHFMMIKGGLQREPTHLNVLLNWTPLR